MEVDVARCRLVDLDIATSRATSHRARNMARPDIARSGLQPNLASQIFQLHIARPGLGVHVAVRAFDGLISRATARAYGSIRGHANFVVHRDVAHVHVLNMNVVALLPDGRMLFDLVDIGIPVAAEPMVADVDLPPNEDRSGRTGAHGDVAGMSEQ